MTAFTCLRGLRRALLVALLALAVSACAGDGPGERSLAPAGLDGLPWPADDQTGRQVSDDSLLLRGVDYAVKHGSAANNLSVLRLSPNPGLSWAIYTIGGLGPDCAVASISADFSIVSGSVGDGTGLYWLLANYSLNRWEWVLGTAPAEQFDFATEFSNYVSPNGNLSIACIHTGPGTTQVNSIAIYRSGAGAVVPIPQNLSATATYGKVQLDWDSVPFAQGYNIYRDTDSAFDNPVKVNGLVLAGSSNYDDTTVAPLTQYWYGVSAVRGDSGNEQESQTSETIDITSADSNIPAPQNLAGSGDLGSVDLSWDPVPGAAGYLVYRDINRSFDAPVAVSGIVATTQFNDTAGLAPDRIYYYCVTAVAQPFESDFSNMVDISVPAADLPAPTNLHVVAKSGDYVTLAWDYNAGGNDGYYLYLSWYKDFRHDQEFYKRTQISNPANKDYSYFGLPPTTTYFARVCAYDASGKRGRLSDDITFTTEDYWTWSTPPESIGGGSGPNSVITAAGDATLAYFSGSAVRVARRNNGIWGSEAVGLDDTVADSGFGGFGGSALDIAYSGSLYIIGACAPAPEDAWVSIGTLGSWAPFRIDGDDNTALGHGISGHDIKVAADADEFSVTHIHLYDQQNSLYDIRLQQKPTSGGSWDNNQINDDVHILVQHSLAYGNGNLYSMFVQALTHHFYFADQDGGWNWQDISDSPGQNLGLGNDLKAWGSEWITPAYNGATKELFVMDSEAGSWNKTKVAEGLDNLNRMQICVTAPGEAVMIFYSSINGRWFYAALKDGSWSSASILLPGYTIGTFMDITDIGGYPLIVFDDGAGNLLASLGAPPA